MLGSKTDPWIRVALAATLVATMTLGCDPNAGTDDSATDAADTDAADTDTDAVGADAGPPPTGHEETGASWRMAGQNLHNTRHQPHETTITAENAKDLQVKWSVTLEGSVFATPAIENGAVYVPDSAGYLYRLDAETGGVVWKTRVADYVDRRGELVRATPFVTDTALVFGTQNNEILKQAIGLDRGAYMVAVDKETGDMIWSKKVSDTRAPRVTQSAVVYEGVAYVGLASGEENLSIDPLYKCCTHRGSFLALDASTGEILHQEYTVPDGFSGGSVWGSTPVIDPDRGHVYTGTGNNYSVPEDLEQCLQACLDGTCTQAEVRACVDKYPDNHVDSMLALALDNLQIRWAHRAIPYDAFTDPCVLKHIDQKNCPDPAGPDFDFGQGPALIHPPGGTQFLGAGQKSGIYWAFDPASGEVLWQTQVGPGGVQGGSEWGSATDGERIYVAISNSDNSFWELKGDGPFAGFVVNNGFWSALDARTGEILWQTPEPDQTILPLKGPKAPVTVANGVLFGSTTTPGDQDMFALDAATGDFLWRFSSGGTSNSGAAVVDGVVYWGAVAKPNHDAGEHDSHYATGATIVEGSGSLFAFCPAGTPGCTAASS